MDKLPVGQLPDLTQSNNDDEIMVITNSEYNQLKKEKISDLITDFTSTNENNALTKGTDGKMFVTDFGNASNITEGTLPVSVLPDIPKDKLPEIETDDLPDSGITAGTYTYPTDIVVNSKGQVTSITEGQAGANNANQDLSNLGPLGLDKLNQSKALETGSVSSDADVYADVLKYAHSTFDLSKFEVVGSPVITDDGVASGFSGSNYITTSEFKLGNGAWRYSGSFITGNDVSGLQIISCLKGSGITFYNACGAYINNNKLYLSININGSEQTASVDVSPLTYYNFALNFKNPNYVFEVNNEVIKTYNSSELVSFNQSNLVMSIGQYSYSGSAYSGLTGSIDLKSIAIWADGVPVFNGNKTGTDTINGIEIPYTLSNTGSKIVDVAYRDRVQDLYSQTGEALYYTIDEKNQNFTLPMGEIYGMISKNEEILDVIYPIGRPMQEINNELLDNEIWLEGATVSRTDYANLFNVYGTTYGQGDGSTTFQLPDLRDRVLWGSPDGSNGYIEAKLPNIKGSFDGVEGNGTPEGCFYLTEILAINKAARGQGDYKIGFNASLSNPIYSDDATTVQPPAFKVRWKTRFE